MSKTCINCLTEYDDQFDICPQCGFIENAPQHDGKCLQVGTCLEDRYIVGKAEYTNRVTIGYNGYDNLACKKVLISEYFPEDIVNRESDGLLVIPNTENNKEFQCNKSLIYETAKKQARLCQIPPVMKVIDIVFENGTIYIIYNFEIGMTLSKTVLGSKQDELTVKEILFKILNALKILHNHDLYHGNISPDSIFITADNEIKFLDFAVHPPKNSMYAAPERLIKGKSYGAGADTFSFIAIYRLLTAEKPLSLPSQTAPKNQMKRSKINSPIPISAIETALKKADAAPMASKSFNNYLEKELRQKHCIYLLNTRPFGGRTALLISLLIAIIVLIILSILYLSDNWQTQITGRTGTYSSQSEYISNPINKPVNKATPEDTGQTLY